MPTIKEAPYEKERQRIFEKERQRVIKRMKKAIEKEQFKISLLQTIKPGVIYNICLKTGCVLFKGHHIPLCESHNKCGG